MRYRAGSWELRDLASSNGTWVSGKEVERGQQVDLKVGDTLGFGSTVETWTLVDDTPPVACAWARGSEHPVIGGDGLLALPAPDEPRMTIFSDAGAGWLLEHEGRERRVLDGESVEVAGLHFRLALPSLGDESIASTARSGPARTTVKNLGLRFIVSQDEEFVAVTLLRQGSSEELPVRAFHYLLLTLARHRLADIDVADSERGWVHVEDLSQMLGTDAEKVNVDVYRARRQLASHGVVDAPRLIERRPGTGQLRIGIPRLRVEAPSR